MSRIYCCSDIHGCTEAFEYALSIILEHLEEDDTKLLLLGDYIHDNMDSSKVLDRIIGLQKEWGNDKVIALFGNHEEMALNGCKYDKYSSWLQSLPLYYTEGNTIFVHAGIDEEAGEDWEWGTGEDMLIWKYPAETGEFSTGQKIVAGHVYTSEIANNKHFNDIYSDGLSHYYIDGDVCRTGELLILMVDTDNDEYFKVTESGLMPVFPYDEDY